VDRGLRSNPQEGRETLERASSGSRGDTPDATIEAAFEAVQNTDGGWGYFPGKQSWLEPTVYTLLALADQSGGQVFARGWRLVRSWELPTGGWRGWRHRSATYTTNASSSAGSRSRKYALNST
jgi:hypothetical protein